MKNGVITIHLQRLWERYLFVVKKNKKKYFMHTPVPLWE